VRFLVASEAAATTKRWFIEMKMTRIVASVALLSIALTNISMSASVAAADEWMLRVETSSRVCHVQLKTAAPLGDDFKGPFSSRKDACKEASNQYDGTLSDQGKCWTYGNGTIGGCKRDGIVLPPPAT
jgi:hypothetical protein